MTCQTIPAVPPVVAIPSSTTVVPNLGWNSGARSIEEHDDNLYVEFDMGNVTGVACGLATAQRGTDPAFIDFAFLFKGTGGANVFVVLEGGVEKTVAATYSHSDVFRIERRGGAVRYLHGATRVYGSATASSGPLVVVGCMYAGDDQIGVAA